MSKLWWHAHINHSESVNGRLDYRLVDLKDGVTETGFEIRVEAEGEYEVYHNDVYQGSYATFDDAMMSEYVRDVAKAFF